MNDKTSTLKRSMEQRIVGKGDVIDKTIVVLLAGGHLLLEDVPGVGKTSLAKALADSLSLSFARIQCTPDTTPSDITGLSIYNPAERSFQVVAGPVINNIVLADELNRTSPKTQSALLEVMEEHKVTIDGKPLPVPEPFMVIGTQNPAEMAGTYPLPESQLDRFMARLTIGYPDPGASEDMARRFLDGQLHEPTTPVLTARDITEMQAAVRAVTIHEALRSYSVKIVDSTRTNPEISCGVSPRGRTTPEVELPSSNHPRGRTAMTVKFNKRALLPYLLVLAASLVFSSYHGGPASFAWLYAVLLHLPLSAAYIFANYAFLRIYQEVEVHKLVRGEDHKYRAKIENTSILPIHNMRLNLWGDRCTLYEIEDGCPLSLTSLEAKELTSGVSCKYAGSYDIGIESVSFSDPFTIFTVTIDIPYTFRAVVSPPVTDIADTVFDLENRYNSTGLKSRRLTEDTPGSDLRPYQPGDPLSAINWKVSARLSELTTRLPDKLEKREVTIWAEAAYDPERERDLEHLRQRDFFLEFIVSAAWHFAKQGVPVRLLYPAGKLTESTVNSYETFMDFYSIVADGIFYYSEQDFEQFKSLTTDRLTTDHLNANHLTTDRLTTDRLTSNHLTADQRSTANDNTRILIREAPEPGEAQYTIYD